MTSDSAGQTSIDRANGVDYQYEVIAVRFGHRTTKASEVFLNWFRFGEADRQIEMDYYFWIIRRPGFTAVIDTGFTPDVGQRRGRATTCEPRKALDELGIDPAEVDIVVITHGHYDHTGNVALFSAARIIVADREMAFWRDPVSRRDQLGHAVEWPDVEFIQQLHEEGRVETVTGRQAIAPGIDVLDVGGHTPGQLVTVVQAQGGSVVLCADAVHYYEELDKDRLFVTVADLREMYRAFDTIRDLARVPGTVLVPGHDPEVMARFPAYDSRQPELAVRIA